MTHSTIAKLAASTLVLGVTMVGCKPAAEGSRPRSASKVGTQPEQQAGKAANAALTAASRQDFAVGVAQAETAVGLVPQDAGYRAMLGDLYLKSGRFESAASAYTDALKLNPGDAKAKLSLALAQIGLGRNADAIATLSAEGEMAAADRGLALALAGDKEGAIRLLSAAAREQNATGRVRQNLALAYALAGDWTQARAIAAQDVSAAELDARMAKWAEFAQPKASYDQVAALLGVSPVSDPGQPTRLALSSRAAAPVQTAAAEPAMPTGRVAEAMVEPEAVAYAQATPAESVPVDNGATEAPAAAALADSGSAEVAPSEVTPVVAAAMRSVERALPSQMARPIARTIRAAASVPVSLKGRYVVQIGAFASADRVEQAWNGAVSRLDRLANYIPASTRFAVGRGSLTRLSVGGFAARQSAVNLCNSLRTVGGTCFVRATAGDAPVRWASRNARNG